MKGKRILSLLLVIVLAAMPMQAVTNANTTAPVWDGSIDTSWYDTNQSASEYTIFDGKTLAGLAKLVNEGHSFQGKKIILNNSINLDNLEWTPIGNSTNRFMGTFDGGNYKIQNLKISSGTGNLGLFGYAGENNENKSDIRNLKLTNCNIQVSDANSVGTVAGYIYGTIENCSATGNISGYDCVGGIAGNVAYSIIKDCSSNIVVRGYSRVGGVAGRLLSSSMMDCNETGEIVGIGVGDDFNKKEIGGLVGCAEYNSILTRCCFVGNVSGSDWNRMGGIAGGVIGATVQDCYSLGNVSGAYNVGGLVGYLYGSMSNCYTTGSVSANYNCGRVAGYISEYTTVKYCYYQYFEADMTGIAGITDVNGVTILGVSSKTGGEFMTPEMAWILNTSNGTARNSGIWAQGGTPVFANGMNCLPVYKVTLNNITSPQELYTGNDGSVILPENPSDNTGRHFFGWYTDHGTYSEKFNQASVIAQDIILYANFGTRIISISDYIAFYTGTAIEFAGTVEDNANSVMGITDLTYLYYTDSAGTKKTTVADSGAAFEGGAPVRAGTYYVRATAAEDTSNKIDAAESNLAKMIVSNVTIASIKPVQDVEVEFGTSEIVVCSWYLSQQTSIIDNNGLEHSVDLDWVIDGYHDNMAGVYIATGTFTLPETVVQSSPSTPLQVTAKVTVWPAVNAAISHTTMIFDLDKPQDITVLIDWGSANFVTTVVKDAISLVEDIDWKEDGYWDVDWHSVIIISKEYLSGLGMKAGDTAEFELFFDIGEKAVLKVEAVTGHTLGNNAFLRNLYVGNIPIPDFAYDKYNYTIKLPYGTLPYNPVAIAHAICADPKAIVEIEQANELPGIAKVEVTAEDGITKKVYELRLTLAKSTEHTLNITANSGGTISVGSSGYYEEGMVIAITAAPVSGYRFHQWTSDKGGSFGNASSANTTFTMPANATTIKANFIYNGSSGTGDGDSKGSGGGNNSSVITTTGSISIDLHQVTGSPSSSMNNNEEKLKNKIFTLDELSRINAGENARVILNVKDITSEVSDADKKLIKESLRGQSIGMYIDLSLYKQIGNEAETAVRSTNGKISISIEIPEYLRNLDTMLSRTFNIIRIHNGVATTVEGTYDPVTHLFTFETDRFSTYALTYMDTLADEIIVTKNFNRLRLTAKAGLSSHELTYRKVIGADGYEIYAAQCKKGNKPKGKKLKLHAKEISYESTDPEVATVSSSGRVEAKSKGSCLIYAYTQNGVSKKIKVTVK